LPPSNRRVTTERALTHPAGTDQPDETAPIIEVDRRIYGTGQKYLRQATARNRKEAKGGREEGATLEKKRRRKRHRGLWRGRSQLNGAVGKQAYTYYQCGAGPRSHLALRPSVALQSRRLQVRIPSSLAPLRSPRHNSAHRGDHRLMLDFGRIGTSNFARVLPLLSTPTLCQKRPGPPRDSCSSYEKGPRQPGSVCKGLSCGGVLPFAVL
jgi:hypothetical protein